MLDLASIMIGSHQPRELAKFYIEVLRRVPDMREGDWSGWQMTGSFFSIGEHSEVKGKAKEPQRLIFNFETESIQEEFARIKDIKGVKVIKEPYSMGGMWVATFADPDGNYFQLNSPWEEVD
jgi:predicted enzyme related to lactoylglutathione lyase